MRGAFNSYQQELGKKKEEKETREKLYEIEKESKTTQKKQKEGNSAAAEAAYLAHQEILDVAYKPKRKLPSHWRMKDMFLKILGNHKKSYQRLERIRGYR